MHTLHVFQTDFSSDIQTITPIVQTKRGLCFELFGTTPRGKGVSKFEPRKILGDRIDIFIVIWRNTTFVTRDFINHHYSYHMNMCQNC